MHPFYRLVRQQVADQEAAWHRLVESAHGGDVRCSKCRERICERLPSPKPPYAYRCALCDRGVPALGQWSQFLDLTLAPWETWLEQLVLAVTFGPKNTRRPTGHTNNRLRRIEAVRDEADRLVRRSPDFIAALFGLAELPSPVTTHAVPSASNVLSFPGGAIVRLPQPEEPAALL